MTGWPKGPVLLACALLGAAAACSSTDRGPERSPDATLAGATVETAPDSGPDAAPVGIGVTKPGDAGPEGAAVGVAPDPFANFGPGAAAGTGSDPVRMPVRVVNSSGRTVVVSAFAGVRPVLLDTLGAEEELRVDLLGPADRTELLWTPLGREAVQRLPVAPSPDSVLVLRLRPPPGP